MKSDDEYSAESISIDCVKEVDRISAILNNLLERFKRRGFVLGLSGGVDSSVACALCVEAVGKDRVLGLLMPEKDSSEDTIRLSKTVADHFGVQQEYHDITPILDAVGCYANRDAAIQDIIPEYTSEYSCKITLPSIFENAKYRLFSITVESPDGVVTKKRLSLSSYLGILSASNFKQRVRKMLEYFYADKLNYVVIGTPNRLEYDQGFFVKLGDGSADIKPIAHLYKTQVYQMANHLGVPSEICERQPTTDTYSMPQSQEEFFFSLPYDKMDLCLFGKNNGISIQSVADAAGLSEEQVLAVYEDIEAKRQATQYLHASPILIENITEVVS